MENTENTRESMQFDVVIVGAGPAGLATAINLAKLYKENNQDYNICLLEKGANIGAHILSGAVLETTALDELIPNWQELNAPITTKVTKDQFYFLTKNYSLPLPVPKDLKNNGNYIISLSKLCQWLATYAENLGIQIFPGFAATEVLYDDSNTVTGVATNSVGIDKNGKKKENFQPGIELHAKYTVFAEGCRGQLSQQIIKKFQLNKNSDPQTYGLGIKEIWQIPKENHKTGNVIHTIGWPLDRKTYGGSFIYYLKPDLLAIGFVIGLDYKNPYLDPFQEFQRFKQHPKIKKLLLNGKRLSYGARSLNEGGLQSIPNLHFPGGLLVGCAAGFLNVAKIKGSHTAMKSGILAAECIFKDNITEFNNKIKNSWITKELHKSRNIRPAFKKGLFAGIIYSAIDTYIFRGNAPWTLKNTEDHTELENKNQYKPLEYPKPDNIISFDKMSSVLLSNTMHTEDQPIHLKLKDLNIPIEYNLAMFNSPETKYCPAGVYEIVKLENAKPYLQINATNCLHCKACDIKDPKQNIVWTAPEGGGGPNYVDM